MFRTPFFKKIITTTQALLLASLLFISVATPAHAQTKEWSGVCVGSATMNSGIDASDVATIQGFQCLLANSFIVIISFIGLAGFVMFIVAAFRYMVSAGSSKGAEAAKNTATHMVIGIIVALSGFIILNLLSSFTGINLTKIYLPSSDRGLDGDTYTTKQNGTTGPF
ncbi:hypothetical protein KA082_01640 [Candidatus Woesebacteria bacterium]|nr:hypothetical protein [Candidatus Woesebacteria bacterium]